MQALHILLIEDDQIEAIKFKKVLTAFNDIHQVEVAVNGEEALKRLHSDREMPDIILLDLNMPKMNGIEFLKVLKQEQGLRYTPVIILTTSNNHEDVKASYEAGAAGYLLKPLRYQDYKNQINMLVEYWSQNEIYK